MKYEAVFGNQELFDGAGTFTGLDVVVHSIASGIKSYARLSDLTPESLRNHPVCAMRRIIKDPKRWTREDKKSGRLPEVGAKCRQGHKDEIVVAVTEKFVVTECQDMSVCTTRKDVFMRSYNPIETPEEKAARLKYEWCAKAAKQLKNLEYTSTLTSIYDALLSGELPPVQAERG
jgi:hypothetical protein